MALLEVSLRLRYDTFNNWSASDLILLAGEAAVAAFPGLATGDPPRAFGIKVGDGTRYFRELPWIQALALDVPSWAKEPTKPVYTADEIDGLAEFINLHGGGSGGGDSGEHIANEGAYRIIYDSTHFKYILLQWNEEDLVWENTPSEIDVSALNTLSARLTGVENWANGYDNNIGNIEVPLTLYINDAVTEYLLNINRPDRAVAGEAVMAVSLYAGAINVTRAPINMSDIKAGILPTTYGGTGVSGLDENEIVVGVLDGPPTKKTLVSTITNVSDAIPTTGAVAQYVANATANLARTMHFIGETSEPISGTHSTTNPRIYGYDFNSALPGDVILANEALEYIWTGEEWRLLGDEENYAVKGQIIDEHIHENANIALSKIRNLTTDLENKVDKIDDYSLISNDDLTKLHLIEDHAQVNIIESILLNDEEIEPNNAKEVHLNIPVLTLEQLDAIESITSNVIEHIFVNGQELIPDELYHQPKSVEIEFLPYTQEERDKLEGIEEHAEVNNISVIKVNGRSYEPNQNKEVNIGINVVEGARYPLNDSYQPIDITNGLLELSKVAATGNISDLTQINNTYIILNCGSSIQVM